MFKSQNKNEKPQPPAQGLKSMNSVGKTSYLRDIVTLKGLMQKRSEQRGLTIYYLTNNKSQLALIYCRQLTFSSMKIYKQYQDQYNEQFQQNFFYRTSRAKEHLEYLLDSTIACKVFLNAKKREDAIDILQKVEINENQKQNIPTPNSNQNKIKFNQAHEIMSKMCAVLLTFIQIAKFQKLYQHTQKFYKIYVKYIKNNYGVIQYSTALFKYGCFLYQIKKYEAAQDLYKTCVQIRKKNVINSCLVDALINLAICQRQIASYQQAILNTKDAIQIYKDIKIQDQQIDKYYLFLAKLCLQAGQFKQSYFHYLNCYKHRMILPKDNPAKVEIQLNFMFFFKILKDIIERPKQLLNYQQKKIIEQKRKQAHSIYQIIKHNILQRQQFSKYRDFKSSKFSHLTIFVTKEFFQALNSTQVVQLITLLNSLGDLTFNRGMIQLQKCSFYQQKKLRDMLIQANNHLKKGVPKKSSQSSFGL